MPVQVLGLNGTWAGDSFVTVESDEKLESYVKLRSQIKKNKFYQKIKNIDNEILLGL